MSAAPKSSTRPSANQRLSRDDNDRKTVAPDAWAVHQAHRRNGSSASPRAPGSRNVNRRRTANDWKQLALQAQRVGGARGFGDGTRADEEMRRQDVERLECAFDLAEHTAQVGEQPRGELIDEERPARLERGTAGEQDVLAQLGGDRAERDAGDDARRFRVPEILEYVLDVGRRALHNLEALVRVGAAQEPDEFRAALDGNEGGVRAHAPQDFRRDVPDAGPVFHNDAHRLPVHTIENATNQKTQARDHRAEHDRVPEEGAREQHTLTEATSLTVLHGFTRLPGRVNV